MADVQGLLADPRFQGLDPSTQRETLGKLDPRFSKLTDDQFSEFKTKASPQPARGLVDRVKDYFSGPNAPSLDTFMHGSPIKGPDGVERMPQGGYSPAEEFVLGGMIPSERVPTAIEAAGQQLRGGRVGKFFKGIGEKAADIAEERKAASDPDFAKLKKSAEGWKPGKRPNPKSSGPNLSEDHGPAPSPKGPPSKAQAVKSAPTEPTVTPPKGRAPRESDAFYETQGRADKVFRVADDMFRKKITAQALEAKGKPGSMSETTWKHILFRLRGLETGRVKPITPG